MPAIMRWPKRIPAGVVSDEIAASIDLLPTFAKLAGGAVPSDRIIDGRDIWGLISDAPGAKSPHEAFYYYRGGANSSPISLRAIRRGRWKLHFARARSGDSLKGSELYDLTADIGESLNLVADHSDIVSALSEMAQSFNRELSANVRPIGRLDDLHSGN